MNDTNYPPPFEDAMRVLRPAWHSIAACHGQADLMWDEERVAEAKAICSTCTVQGHCLEYALEHNETGVWGGTTDEERQDYMKKKSFSRNALLGAEAV